MCDRKLSEGVNVFTPAINDISDRLALLRRDPIGGERRKIAWGLAQIGFDPGGSHRDTGLALFRGVDLPLWLTLGQLAGCSPKGVNIFYSPRTIQNAIKL